MLPMKTRSTLSANQQRLVRMMQELNFGRIERLAIRQGEPYFTPLPRLLCDWKIGGENGPRPEAGSDDFALRRPVVELFEQFERIDTGVVEVLEVKHGLPFKIVFEQTTN